MATGSGHATHLGRTTVSAHGTGSLVLPPVPCTVNGAPGFEVATSLPQVTLTAANGDQLFMVGPGGTFCSLLSGGGSGTGTLVITGGTGRFAGASGSATFVSNNTPSVFVNTAEGTISY